MIKYKRLSWLIKYFVSVNFSGIVRRKNNKRRIVKV